MHPIARFKRHIVQLFAALLYNLNFAGFAEGSLYQGVSKGVCVPGLNCYSCPGAIGSCPIGALQNSLIASDHRLPFYVVGTLLAIGALFGRTVCGWLCPFGLLQDLLDKVPFPKVAKGRWSRVCSAGKYMVLVALVLIAPLVVMAAEGVGTPTFCSWLCPQGTLEAGIPLVLSDPSLKAMIGWLFDWKVVVLLAILVASLFIYRPFCRFLCPLGAIYSLFNRFALLRYHVDEDACTHCGACEKACKVDIRNVSDRECIQCGRCVTICPSHAISFTGSDMLPKHTHNENMDARKLEIAEEKAAANEETQGHD